VVFDGDCGLFNKFVEFVTRRDGRERFSFLPSQAEASQDLLDRYRIRDEVSRTVVLIEDGRCHFRSEAVFRILRDLGGIWTWLFRLRVLVPRPIRDTVYDRVAANRDRWFGCSSSCKTVPRQNLDLESEGKPGVEGE